jgi:opacity protein-like surface antigen
MKKKLVVAILAAAVSVFASTANAYDVIKDTAFQRNFPAFKKALNEDWPVQKKAAAYFAGQAEQESCASQRMCWNEKTEAFSYNDMLSGKAREYGFGISQITITKNFNNFTALKKENKNLAGWEFDKRFDAEYQFIAMFTLDRQCYNQVKWAGKEDDRYAFMFSCYNGGYGGIIKDRAVCRATKGCDQNLWWNNVENTSTKSKVPSKVYGGQSMFSINRAYPKNIMKLRAKKYVPLLQDFTKPDIPLGMQTTQMASA